MEEEAREKIELVDIEEEMKSSYIDYAMSVIVGRALPDVRDGLKPVHRRILYAMYDMGMFPGRPYKKCARIVGEVLGKYHPHGDIAVYDSLARMAQDFSHRYRLIDGYGNFGSVDGDSPAAMRYTEARLPKLAMELLRDIEKETVNFIPNFDETLQEPEVLPSRFPNLLVNGSSGIAVGMATNIPPHNLGEVIDGVIQLIDKPGTSPGELMKVIKGPDFPTGGAIIGRSGIRDAYETGRGSIRVRGKAKIEQTQTGRTRIVVTELPFQVNKARLAEKIAELVREKKLIEVSDLRDESDRQGMRLVIELKRGVIPKVVLNKLYKHTQIEAAFGIIALALVDGVPRVLSLSQYLQHYLNYQKEVVTRRSQFELAKAEKQAHILEGLLIALKNLNQVIQTIRRSKTVEDAKKKLMADFKLSEKQATAILEMRLQRLTALEREKVKSEYENLIKRIAELKTLLASEKKILKLVRQELLEIKEKYADERRTDIKATEEELEIEDLIADEDMVITITQAGYVKRLPVATYRRQKRGGRGVIGTDLKEGDIVEHLFISSTHDILLFFSSKGKVYQRRVYELPLAGRRSRGEAIINILPFEQDEKIAAVINTRDFPEGEYLVMATKNGLVKKTKFKDYDTKYREKGIIALALRKGDELIEVKRTKGKEDIFLVSRGGQSVRFSEKGIRSMGRVASGVKGMRLSKGDEVLGMEIAMGGHALLVITERGWGKRTPLSKYRTIGRGCKGVRTIKITKKGGKLAGAKMVREDQGLIVTSVGGTVIRMPVKGIRVAGRDTQGVRIMNLKGRDKVSALARVTPSVKKDKEADESEAKSEETPAEKSSSKKSKPKKISTKKTTAKKISTKKTTVRKTPAKKL